MVSCQIVEGLSLRQIVIRIDDSNFLRQFVRIYNGPMIDFTAYCKLKNCIRPETWKQMNGLLAQAAVGEALHRGSEAQDRHHRRGDQHPLADRFLPALGHLPNPGPVYIMDLSDRYYGSCIERSQPHVTPCDRHAHCTTRALTPKRGAIF